MSTITATVAVDAHCFGFVSDVVLPALLDRGVSQADVDLMTIGNPARFFGGGAS